jgi:predicted DNA-binding transcriptional regulator AlpA
MRNIMAAKHEVSAASGAAKVYLTAIQLRTRYGGVSDMWLWRRVNDRSTGFPQPKYFGRRRFWELSDIETWERQAAAASKAA